MAEEHSHDSETQVDTQVVEQSENGSTMMNESSKSKFQADTFSRIVRSSAVMEVSVARARRFAKSLAPILIQGETGVGKELFASAIQAESTLADGPFVVCNCGALSEELIGSELFGYVKGAFTGASNEGRIGRFEEASGGTLCLDEIGELPPNLQPYLLRVLDEGMVYRIGENKPRKVQVRLLAMTNRNLLDEVAAGHFRRDLFHRISVTTVAVPPLRERVEDIGPLVTHFQLHAVKAGLPSKTFTPEALRALKSWHWPGNVRELENLVRRMLVLHADNSIDAAAVEREFPASQTEVNEDAESLSESVDAHIRRYFDALKGGMPAPGLYGRILREVEHPLILATLEVTRGNQVRAADILGLNRNTLRKKIKDLNIKAGR